MANDPGPLTGANDEHRRGLFAKLVKRIKAHGVTHIFSMCDVDKFLSGPIPAQGIEGSWTAWGAFYDGPDGTTTTTDRAQGRTGEEAFRALAAMLEEPK